MVIRNDITLVSINLPDNARTRATPLLNHLHDARLHPLHHLHQRVRKRIGQQGRYRRSKNCFLSHVYTCLSFLQTLFALSYGYLQGL